MAARAFIGLGANLGEAQRTVEAALQSLADAPGVHALRASSLYASAPVDAGGDDYVNAVAEIHTSRSAPALLQLLQQLEQGAGRQRPYLNAPRTLDLDLLLYGQGRIVSPALVVPHPRMHQRAFVLLPLQELAPDLVDFRDLENVTYQRVQRL